MNTLVLAYLCEPNRGSERGAGWGMIQALLRFSDCMLICGPEAGSAIARWRADREVHGLEVEVVPEPLWGPLAKRTRIGEFLTYLSWQRRARRVGRRLAERGSFDVAYHATLSAFWLPSVATEFGLPSVWGPVGGAVTTPVRLWPLLGWKGAVVEVVDWLAVRLMSLLGSTRRTWRAATVRIAQNRQTVSRLPSGLRATTVVLNHAEFHRVPRPELLPPEEVPEPYVAWVSPMESRKGPELAVRAIAAASSSMRMVMAGDGPERARMEALAQDLGVANRITFLGMVPHHRALEVIRNADVAVFTGLREEGGLALAEALLMGTPVVVLANGGADAIAQAATRPDLVARIEPGSTKNTVTAMARALDVCFERERGQPKDARSPLLDQKGSVETLRGLVNDAASGNGGADQ